MKTRYLVLTAAMLATLSFNLSAAEAGETGQAAEEGAPAAGTAAYPADMMQRMQEMRRQHMEMMQANPQAMPPMGPGRGMMNPQMMQQRMQEMRQQHMEMMQANRRGMPMAGANAAAQPAQPDQEAAVAAEDTVAVPTGPGMGCAHRQGEGGMRGYGMKKQMMAMRQQHMQSVEARLANIEDLMRELVDLAKSNR